MKNNLLFGLLLLFSCSKSPLSIEGKWKMYAILQNGENVTDKHDPYDERVIEFRPDGTFISSGRPFGHNAGKYDYKQDSSLLFLDSDVGPNDDSQWKVEIQDDTMTWHGFGTAWAEDFVIIQTRK